MQHHESIEPIVCITDQLGNPHPMRWTHIRRIHRWIERQSLDHTLRLMQFGHMPMDLSEVNGFQSPETEERTLPIVPPVYNSNTLRGWVMA